MPHFSALAFTAFECTVLSQERMSYYVKATKLCLKILLFRPFINLSWHSFSIGANHQSFIVLRTLNSTTKSVGLEGRARRGEGRELPRPKEGGGGGKAAGGRVIGKDWSPERQREGRGVRKAEIKWGGWGWGGGGKGRGAWSIYAAKLPLEALLINLQLCPHKLFSGVKVKKETGNRRRESISFSFFIQVPLESSALVPCPATGCQAGSLPHSHRPGVVVMSGPVPPAPQPPSRALSSFLSWFTVGYMMWDVLGRMYWVHC